MRIEQIALLALALVVPSAIAQAQEAETEPVAVAEQAEQAEQAAAPVQNHVNPWQRRPACASMFLKSDWRLTGKQRACDWVRNRLFSNSAIGGAAASAFVSKFRDAESEIGDPVSVRFGRRFAQSSFKSTAAYLGGLIAREDPRGVPPYLVMRRKPRPRGFWRRTGHALANNVLSWDCGVKDADGVKRCTSEEHIKRRFALSRVLGAIASGYGSEVWTWDRATSHERAWRGAASAYGSSFVDALYTEFKPELTAAVGKVFGGVFGFK